MYRQIRALWKVLTQQAVSIFVCAALPRAVRVAQKDVDIRRQGEDLVPGHLTPAIPSQ